MKKLILLLFISLISFSSFGQAEVTQLMRIAEMDLEKFEIFAFENNYTFDELIDDKDAKGLSMVKGYGNETEYLTVYEKYYEYKYASGYQGGKQKRLPTIYKELKKLGFKLFNTSNFKSRDGWKSYLKEYKRGAKELVNIFIFEDGVTIELSYKVYY